MFEDLDKTKFIDDISRPNCLITSIYTRSFAYTTITEEIPEVFKIVIGNLAKDEHSFFEKFGAECATEVSKIVKAITNLKSEILVDKKLMKFTMNEKDEYLWNNFISSLITDNNTYFTTCLLYSECYIYRRLKAIFEESIEFKHFDYFRLQKEANLIDNMNLIEKFLTITNHIDFVQNPKICFINLLKINLWGNKLNLLGTDNDEVKLNKEMITNINSLDKLILIDNSIEIWKHISAPFPSNKERIIDFVINNSGYEMFTDLLLADFLIVNKYATKIRFYVKPIPWFILNATQSDFNWIINFFEHHNLNIVRTFSNKLIQYLHMGALESQNDNTFWTSPYEFYRMKEFDSELYRKLSEAYLVIFKGDLNYRKLIGDFKWNTSEEFSECLRGFHPTSICSIRTIKSEVICGLAVNQARQLNATDPMWMVSSKYGLIKYFHKEKSEIQSDIS